ncbi:RNase adapter RapZ [Mycoplasmatota bacterium]|nr:RNase adapter RapZ [Mycoplasmatota bacterium]
MTKLVKNLLLVTGMSGAGKSVALNCLEDIGYYCIDNMPVVLLNHITSLTSENNLNYNNIENFAVVVDSRSQDFSSLFHVIDEIRETVHLKLQILFLDANDDVLVKRFKETRRMHPLSKQGSIIEGIILERQILESLREQVDYIIDTSYLSSNKLKKEITSRFSFKKNQFDINIMSFGFKHGAPIDCDYVFDVRFLPNPFYIDEMRNQTGLDEEVYDYVIKREDTTIFLEKLVSLLNFVIPKFGDIAKNQVLIGIGCSGGQHRSVAISEALYASLAEQYNCYVWHRDIDKIRKESKHG